MLYLEKLIYFIKTKVFNVEDLAKVDANVTPNLQIELALGALIKGDPGRQSMAVGEHTAPQRDQNNISMCQSLILGYDLYIIQDHVLTMGVDYHWPTKDLVLVEDFESNVSVF